MVKSLSIVSTLGRNTRLNYLLEPLYKLLYIVNIFFCSSYVCDQNTGNNSHFRSLYMLGRAMIKYVCVVNLVRAHEKQDEKPNSS